MCEWYLCVCLSTEVMGPGGFITLKPIPINRLDDYCKLYHKNNNKLFREEFEVTEQIEKTRARAVCSYNAR